jgi:acyl carrier protein
MPAVFITAESIISLLAEHHLVETDEPLMPDSNLFALGLDSLATMHLMLHLERAFGITIPASAVTRENFATPEKLAESVNTQARAL